MEPKNSTYNVGNLCIRKIEMDNDKWLDLLESYSQHNIKCIEPDDKDSMEIQIHSNCAEEAKKWMRACGVLLPEDYLLFDKDGNYIGLKEDSDEEKADVKEDKPRTINIPDEAKGKLDKWITEFCADPHFIEDRKLFDALYSCICYRVKESHLSRYLQENKDKFIEGTNTDAIICRAMDCYYAMEYLVWAQNGRINKYRPSSY